MNGLSIIQIQTNTSQKKPGAASITRLVNRSPTTVIPKFFPGPSSAQALGISPVYHLPISICRTSSLLPALIGAFQALQLVAPILLNDPATSQPATVKSLLINPIEYWQIWMDIAWVIYRWTNCLLNGVVCRLWVFVFWIYGWFDVTVVGASPYY